MFLCKVTVTCDMSQVHGFSELKTFDSFRRISATRFAEPIKFSARSKMAEVSNFLKEKP